MGEGVRGNVEMEGSSFPETLLVAVKCCSPWGNSPEAPENLPWAVCAACNTLAGEAILNMDMFALQSDATSKGLRDNA